MKAKKLMALFLFGLIVSGLKAQTMYVRPITGSQSSYTLANIKNLTFSSSNLVVTPITGSNGTFPLSGNRSISFTDFTLATSLNEVISNRFYVYPNPVIDVLNIRNDDSTQTITNLVIISLDGREVITQNSPQVTLAALPRGLYFCKITSNNQTQIIKFLKQ